MKRFQLCGGRQEGRIGVGWVFLKAISKAIDALAELSELEIIAGERCALACKAFAGLIDVRSHLLHLELQAGRKVLRVGRLEGSDGCADRKGFKRQKRGDGSRGGSTIVHCLGSLRKLRENFTITERMRNSCESLQFNAQ